MMHQMEMNKSGKIRISYVPSCAFCLECNLRNHKFSWEMSSNPGSERLTGVNESGTIKLVWECLESDDEILVTLKLEILFEQEIHSANLSVSVDQDSSMSVGYFLKNSSETRIGESLPNALKTGETNGQILVFDKDCPTLLLDPESDSEQQLSVISRPLDTGPLKPGTYLLFRAKSTASNPDLEHFNSGNTTQEPGSIGLFISKWIHMGITTLLVPVIFVAQVFCRRKEA